MTYQPDHFSYSIQELRDLMIRTGLVPSPAIEAQFRDTMGDSSSCDPYPRSQHTHLSETPTTNGYSIETTSQESNMSLLLTLPHEILHNVLSHVDAKDLASVNATCRELHKFVPGNELLWRDVYHNKFDERPAQSYYSSVEPIPSWEKDSKDFVVLESMFQAPISDPAVAHSKSVDDSERTAILERYHSSNVVKSCLLSPATSSSDREKASNIVQFAGKQIVDLLRNAKPHNSRTIELLTALFASRGNRVELFCRSQIFQRLDKTIVADFADRQMSAKLHCLYGIMMESSTHRPTRRTRTYPYACSKLYDLRNYTQKTMWGPFKEDGSGDVDWERMEAIMIVLSHNLKIIGERQPGFASIKWNMAWAESVPYSYISKTGPRPENVTTPLDLKDPYNVTGTYMRIVSFLDFTELFAYNFALGHPPEGEPRGPLDTTEAIRLIMMEIRVTKVEPPGPEDGQSLPVVHFKGVSRSMHSSWDPNANSGIRGTVRLTKEGEIRWTSFSVYDGEERWRSESVQIGGLCSARGIIGNWFDKDFDAHGPAGPTAYWKISDEIVEHEGDDDVILDPNFDVQVDVEDVDDDDDDDDSNSGDEDDNPEMHHQALIDMLAHFHAHHQEIGLNGETVFTGFGGMGVVEETTIEEVEETEEIVDEPRHSQANTEVTFLEAPADPTSLYQGESQGAGSEVAPANTDAREATTVTAPVSLTVQETSSNHDNASEQAATVEATDVASKDSSQTHQEDTDQASLEAWEALSTKET